MADEHTPDLPAAVPACPKCGGDMWDNTTSKRNPKAPDYKCKDSSCGGVIWPKRAPGAVPTGVTAGDGGGGPAVAVPQHAGTPDDPACPVCGGRMWDDRASKRNPRAPDFKCRNKPREIGGPGCPGVIWPPRDGERRPAASAASAARRNPEPPKMPDREMADDEPPAFEDDDLPF